MTFRHQRETYCLLTVPFTTHSITNLHLNCLKHNECTRSREHSHLSRGDVDLWSKMHLKFAFSPLPICFSVSRSEAEKLASGDPSGMPEWHLTSNCVCRWPRRTELNNRRHVPLWPRHHGNARPFGEVARGVSGSKLSLYPDRCNVCCMWTGEDITLTPHKSVI